MRAIRCLRIQALTMLVLITALVILTASQVKASASQCPEKILGTGTMEGLLTETACEEGFCWGFIQLANGDKEPFGYQHTEGNGQEYPPAFFEHEEEYWSIQYQDYQFWDEDAGKCVQTKSYVSGKVLTVASEKQDGQQFSDLATLQKAAAQGDAAAQSKLAHKYFSGDGVLEDLATAALWYQKAAEQGNVEGQLGLAGMYQLGSSVVPKDESKAILLLQNLAKQGNVEAQLALGGIYMTRDETTAKQWFQKAAAQGNEDARRFLDWMENFARLQKSAEQGNAEAQAILGEFYKEGLGVPVDISKAVQWYQKAAAQGNEDARRALDEIKATGQSVPKK